MDPVASRGIVGPIESRLDFSSMRRVDPCCRQYRPNSVILRWLGIGGVVPHR